MRRHPVLQPFSRDHNVGLVIGRKLSAQPGESVPEFLTIWDDEMADHFLEEEQLLAPYVSQELSTRLFSDHDAVRRFVVKARSGEASEDEARRIGEMLHEHIRWEERELFPAVEEAGGSLEPISKATEAMEKRRHSSPHAPRRAELANRRRGT